MSEFVLRAGTARDVPAMHRLDALCFQPPFQFDMHSMRRFVLEPGAFSIVAERGWAMAGFIVVSMWRRRRMAALAYIVTLDVHPELRRKGLASEMVAAAELRAADQGAEAILLHVHAGNAAAISFYEAAGYTRLELIADFYASGRDGWLYRKALERLPISLASNRKS
jgi:ribosomal-protein-alanine N-acetyltransferase